MYKLLLSNGCSHTAGNEMEFTGQPFCYEKAWPKHLSNKLALENINIAKAGASNQRIFRTTQDWIIENILINKTYRPEDIIVFVMWSGFDRKEIYFPDTNVIDDLGFASIATYYNTQLHKELEILQKSFVTFHDVLVSCYESLNLVYNLSLFLEKFNISYRFLNGLYIFEETNNLNNNHPLYNPYKNLLAIYGDRIDNHLGFHELDDLYTNHMAKYSGIDIPKHSLFSHYGEDGHIYWANRLFDFYFKKETI